MEKSKRLEEIDRMIDERNSFNTSKIINGIKEIIRDLAQAILNQDEYLQKIRGAEMYSLAIGVLFGMLTSQRVHMMVPFLIAGGFRILYWHVTRVDPTLREEWQTLLDDHKYHPYMHQAFEMIRENISTFEAELNMVIEKLDEQFIAVNTENQFRIN